ncbi:hypothetical protein BpHYR1_028709 [Brachionus plicatilis]|uniref:Uncharacterized protein n=1 Tax=Brachionus plicatilis TaxID=10195 RepID=A0A3M7Q4F5_BRAPC|nr:hypothetical protein BpHYR1_028709 [Brachionus plicatilis]
MIKNLRIWDLFFFAKCLKRSLIKSLFKFQTALVMLSGDKGNSTFTAPLYSITNFSHQFDFQKEFLIKKKRFKNLVAPSN